VRIHFRMDGGLAAFPGLARPVTIDCDALPPSGTAHWRALLHRADFFALPERADSARLPDARSYTIGVDDGAQCRTVTVSEPIANPALRDLVDALRTHARTAGKTR
jgi:emfourin